MLKNKESIIEFVQKTLGCSCTLEVFNDIDMLENHKLCQYTVLKYKLKIGGKLLIYVIENPDIDYIENNLMNVIFMGKAERDSAGLNRFRLVLVSDQIEKIRNASEELFLSMSGNDDRMHLHLISPADLPVL